ncbi:MAG: hypothetical protein CMB57_06695 [Euryarchaeota archaeon]|nr:hypothetical protein [Euryarchaeota archaeon]
MAQQLSGLRNLNTGVVPIVKPGEEIFTYPENSNANLPARPNTVLYGTAPFRGGGGAPAQLIDVSDELRPQSTTRFGKALVQPMENTLFPVNNSMDAPPPPAPRGMVSSRAEVQNELYEQRYGQ